MTEYWKSLPRKFCVYCKCWITDNKSSVDFHEKGKNHQDNVKKKLDELRKKGQTDAKEKESVNSYLKAMEAAALKAAKDDLKRDPNLASMYGSSAIADTSAATAVEPSISKSPSAPGPGRPKTHKESGKKVINDKSLTDSLGNLKREATDAAVTISDARAEDEWQKAVSPEGYEYYWNVRTGESAWTVSEKAAHTDSGARYAEEEASDKPCKDEKQSAFVPASCLDSNQSNVSTVTCAGAAACVTVSDVTTKTEAVDDIDAKNILLKKEVDDDGVPVKVVSVKAEVGTEAPAAVVSVKTEADVQAKVVAVKVEAASISSPKDISFKIAAAKGSSLKGAMAYTPHAKSIPLKAAAVKDEPSQAEERSASASQKRPAAPSAYGKWVAVQVEVEPTVDLQLPTDASNFSVAAAAIPLPEEPSLTADVNEESMPQFKERVVTLLGKSSGEVSFKKRKVGAAKQNMRRRDDGDN